MPGKLTILPEDEQLALKIDALLPQTQCRKCGYSGCKPYAQAIAQGKADINQCPPGGDQGIRKLAALLGRPYQPLNPKHGVEKPGELAFIDEGYCIGCTLCIQACPVDAIVGAARQMHTIVAELCTGCELCVPPCPVDCISMLPLTLGAPEHRADAARERHEFRQFREERERQEKTARLATKAAAPSSQSGARQDDMPPTADQATAIADKKALIAAAIARAQQQKAQVKPANTAQLTAEQLAQIAEIEARRK